MRIVVSMSVPFFAAVSFGRNIQLSYGLAD
jgi:hypothetical protein